MKPAGQLFVPFSSVPAIDWHEPNLRFVDLTGDGHADILISEHEVFTWYPSLAEKGFGPSETVRKILDEEHGPALVFGDATEAIFLADMSGDGLNDILRIRPGEVCYWPSLGNGRFGAKVSMGDAPEFESSKRFQPSRVRLSDIDGSGTTDIIYLGANGITIWFNQAGNSWRQSSSSSEFSDD
jgi:hypothetical protein